MNRPLIGASDIQAGGRVPAGALLTPLARDLLRKRGVSVELAAPPGGGAGARRLVIANWKSHKTVAEALTWARDLAARAPKGSARPVVCPPFTALFALGQVLGDLADLGAQDVSPHGEGAHTGEVAARHLRELGCRFALVGHSERRLAGETDALCRTKVRAALREGIDPVLCVGETKDERRGGRAQVVVTDQLRAALEGLDPEAAARVVVAYEPRWAIGAGVTPTDEEIATMLVHARAIVARLFGDATAARVSVLYGGSVGPDNARALLRLPGCAGALVGGASLHADKLAAIIDAS